MHDTSPRPEIMAEGNTTTSTRKSENNRLYYERTKEKRKSEKLRFSFIIKVKSTEGKRLDKIKERLATAKRNLGLHRSSSANADVIEKLLDQYERTEAQQPSFPSESFAASRSFASSSSTVTDTTLQD